MRIAVVGAGAVGGYYGARLAQAGHEVVFIARGANLEVIRRKGITVRSGLGDITIRARAENQPATVGPVDLVILAVKTYSNADALPLLPPLLGARTSVLTLQNGVDSADEIAALLGEQPVLAGATYIIASLVEPGVVQHTGSARRIVFGEAFGARTISPRAAAVEEILRGADIQGEAVADSRIPIWEKFIFLAPFAALSAAARLPLGPLWAVPEFRASYERAMSEVESIARAEEISIAADVRTQKMRYLDESPAASRSSMMMDLAAGRPIELEALLGSVVRRGRKWGLPTPVMEAFYGVLKPFEHGHRV
jgi:2-dehydropantoate 2-reductase